MSEEKKKENQRRQPILTQKHKEMRKIQAKGFLKQYEGDKQAMKIFIDQLKTTDQLPSNKKRLNQIAVHDKSYLRKSMQDKSFLDHSVENLDGTDNSLLPTIKTASNQSTNKMQKEFKQTILSSQRLSQNDYYNKYIHGKTAGGPGRLSSAEPGANFPGSLKKYHQQFIPFDQISKPSL